MSCLKNERFKQMLQKMHAKKLQRAKELRASSRISENQTIQEEEENIRENDDHDNSSMGDHFAIGKNGHLFKAEDKLSSRIKNRELSLLAKEELLGASLERNTNFNKTQSSFSGVDEVLMKMGRFKNFKKSAISKRKKNLNELELNESTF